MHPGELHAVHANRLEPCVQGETVELYHFEVGFAQQAVTPRELEVKDILGFYGFFREAYPVGNFDVVFACPRSDWWSGQWKSSANSGLHGGSSKTPEVGC